MIPARLLIEARAIAENLGVGTAPELSVQRVAGRLLRIEQEATASARTMLHADRLTVEPTSFVADRELVPLLAAGEVAFALRPFPSTNDSPEVVLYGSPADLRDLGSSIDSFVDEVTE